MLVNDGKVELELVTEVNGRQWHLYGFSYETPDGKFSGYLHATSSEHASYMLEELKATAVLDGQIIEAGSF
mgnify:FL=1|tara:strand:- start:209 stop:421 length:213 start_codon:yes stop_codon:yes gene_type:complete